MSYESKVGDSERDPGARLVTQNMLTSAAKYEWSDTLDWASVQDLATAIDLFCFYDRAIVLGRDVADRLNSWNSDFFSSLTKEDFVRSVKLTHEDAEEVSRVASARLATYLGEKDLGRFRHLVEYGIEPSSAYNLNKSPDGSEDVEVGLEWLQTAPSRTELLEQLRREEGYASRGTTFVLRSFLYLSFADVADLTLTPDTVRRPVLSAVLAEEERFRGELIRRLKGEWKKRAEGNRRVVEKLSPFSAVVFSRCNGDRRRIVPEMLALRSEAREFRATLQDIELRVLHGNFSTQKKAQDEWAHAMAKIVERFGAAHPWRLFLRRALRYVSVLGKPFAEPLSIDAWSDVGKLNEDIERDITGRPVAVEFHKFMPDDSIPAVETLRRDLLRLFGKIKNGPLD